MHVKKMTIKEIISYSKVFLDLNLTIPIRIQLF